MWARYSFLVRVAVGAVGVIACITYLVLHTHANIASHHEVSHLFDNHWKESSGGLKPKLATCAPLGLRTTPGHLCTVSCMDLHAAPAAVTARARAAAAPEWSTEPARDRTMFLILAQRRLFPQRLVRERAAATKAVVAAGGTGTVSGGGGTFCDPDAQGAVGTAHAELWGDVVKQAVKPGGKGNEAATAEACCKSCADTRGCNGAAAAPRFTCRSAHAVPARDPPVQSACLLPLPVTSD